MISLKECNTLLDRVHDLPETLLLISTRELDDIIGKYNGILKEDRNNDVLFSRINPIKRSQYSLAGYDFDVRSQLKSGLEEMIDILRDVSKSKTNNSNQPISINVSPTFNQHQEMNVTFNQKINLLAEKAHHEIAQLPATPMEKKKAQEIVEEIKKGPSQWANIPEKIETLINIYKKYGAPILTIINLVLGHIVR